MLKSMRKNTSRIVWVVIIIFVFLGVGGTIINSSQSRQYVGEIFGKKIKYTLFEDAYKMVYFSPRIQNLIQSRKDVTNQMLEDSTFQHLAFQMEATKRHVKVTDDDVRDEIIRRFTIDTNFNPKVYEHWVTNVTNMPLHTYEEGVRKDLLVSKLIDDIKNNISVTEDEIHDYFYKQNRTVKVDYLFTPFDRFKDEVTYTEQELVSFYQENIGTFKTDKKYKFIYTIFSPEQYIESVTVSDEELVSYFEEYKARRSANDEEIQAYADIKETLAQQMKYDKAVRAAQTAALDFKNSVLNIANLKDIATQKNITLQTSDLIPFSKISDEIGWSNDLFNAIDTLGPRKLSLIETSKGSVALQMLDVADPETIPFKEAYDSVEKEYIRKQTSQKAEAIITHVFDTINSSDMSLKDAADKNDDVVLANSELFGINDTEIFDEQTTRDVYNILWNKERGFMTRPIRLKNDSYALFKLVERNDPAKEEFEMAKETIRKQLLDFKQYFEVQQELSGILARADIKKYNQKTDISDR